MDEQEGIQFSLVRTDKYDQDSTDDVKVEVVTAAVEKLTEGIYDPSELTRFINDIVTVTNLTDVGTDGQPISDPNVVTQKIQQWLDSPVGTSLPIRIYPSFINSIDPWIHFTSRTHPKCRQRNDQIPAPPPGTDLGACLILQSLSKKERIAWAVNR